MDFLGSEQFLLLVGAALFFQLVPKRAENLLLLAISWGWYLWFDGYFFLLLLFATIFDYWIAQKIYSCSSRPQAKIMLIASVLVNVSLLFTFKLLFYVSDIVDPDSFMGTAVKYGMPLGISFYTFHSISYVVDVFRKVTPPARSFVAYGVFVSFFPKIMAGPIERYSSFSFALENKLNVNADVFYRSFRLIVLGLFLKLVVSNNLWVLNKFLFEGQLSAHFILNWLSLYSYSTEIYADFLGYTFLARGAALLFGINLAKNFNSPYLANSPKDFWQRWHISLSTWFRDYVYLSLSGNQSKFFLSLFLTMALAGIWHGFGVNFLLWGFYHAFVLAICRLLSLCIVTATIPNFMRQVATFHLVALGWLFFRVESLKEIGVFLKGFFQIKSLEASEVGAFGYFLSYLAPWVVALVILVGVKEKLGWKKFGRCLEAFFLGLAIVAITLFGVTDEIPFAYFKF